MEGIVIVSLAGRGRRTRSILSRTIFLCGATPSISCRTSNNNGKFVFYSSINLQFRFSSLCRSVCARAHSAQPNHNQQLHHK